MRKGTQAEQIIALQNTNVNQTTQIEKLQKENSSLRNSLAVLTQNIIDLKASHKAERNIQANIFAALDLNARDLRVALQAINAALKSTP